MSKIKINGSGNRVTDANGNVIIQHGSNSILKINGKKYLNGKEVKGCFSSLLILVIVGAMVLITIVML